MDAQYVFLARKLMKDVYGLYQPADDVEISVVAKSVTEAASKAKILVDDENRGLTLTKIEER